MRRLKLSVETLQTTANSIITPPDEAQHYMRNVLRMDIGDEIELFDGEGNAWSAVIYDKREMSLQLIGRVEVNVESPLKIRIYQAIPKGERWDWFLEKATELGVTDIVPIETKYSVVTIPANKMSSKIERWKKILDSAARQSGRIYTPTIYPQLSLKKAIAEMPEDYSHYVANPHGEESEIDLKIKKVAIWVGPEGGFKAEEVASLNDAGVKNLSFGRRILRSETAGITAVTKAQILWGDM